MGSDTLVDVVGQIFSGVSGAIGKIKTLASQALNAVKAGLQFIANLVLYAVYQSFASMMKLFAYSALITMGTLYPEMTVSGNPASQMTISKSGKSLNFDITADIDGVNIRIGSSVIKIQNFFSKIEIVNDETLGLLAGIESQISDFLDSTNEIYSALMATMMSTIAQLLTLPLILPIVTNSPIQVALPASLLYTIPNLMLLWGFEKTMIETNPNTGLNRELIRGYHFGLGLGMLLWIPDIINESMLKTKADVGGKAGVTVVKYILDVITSAIPFLGGVYGTEADWTQKIEIATVGGIASVMFKKLFSGDSQPLGVDDSSSISTKIIGATVGKFLDFYTIISKSGGIQQSGILTNVLPKLLFWVELIVMNFIIGGMHFIF